MACAEKRDVVRDARDESNLSAIGGETGKGACGACLGGAENEFDEGVVVGCEVGHDAWDAWDGGDN